MEKDRNLHPGDVFTDKDRKYQVIAVAYHAKSNEKMIVYQQLFDNFKILTDTFDDFFNQPEAEVHIEIPADDRKDNDADTKEDLKGVNPVLMGFFDRDTCTVIPLSHILSTAFTISLFSSEHELDFVPIDMFTIRILYLFLLRIIQSEALIIDSLLP